MVLPVKVHIIKDVKFNKNILSADIQPIDIGFKSPLGARPLTEVGSALPRTQNLKDTSGLPACSIEQRSHYDRNWEQIVSPTVIKSLRKHKQDVLHGGRSLNILLPTKRPTKDWDMYSPIEKKRAQTLERSLDKKMGCNICDVKKVDLPKVSPGPDMPGTSKRLYRVVTEHSDDDADIDVMDKPKGLKTIRRHGIAHESIDLAYKKAVRRMQVQPLQMWKAMEDKQRIEEYWAMKGRKRPVGGLERSL